MRFEVYGSAMLVMITVRACVCVCVCVVVVVVDRDGAERPPPVRAGGGAGRRRGALRLGARCDGAGGEPREPRPGRRRPPLTASIPSPPGHRSRPAMLQRLTVTYVTVVLTTLAAIIDPGLTLARFPLIISSPVRERGIPMSVSVCLSVCLFTRRYTPGTTYSNLVVRHIFCSRCLWQWLGPSLAALRYVMYFRFCG